MKLAQAPSKKKGASRPRASSHSHLLPFGQARRQVPNVLTLLRDKCFSDDRAAMATVTATREAAFERADGHDQERADGHDQELAGTGFLRVHYLVTT